MIASASGSPSAAARTIEFGVPPTASQMGSGSCTGRGYMPAPWSADRCCPNHVTCSASRSSSSSPSFSANSSS